MDRCALCPGIHKCLPPDGDGDVLFIGEAPGINEEKRGRVFIGKTGDEVNRHYLPLAGLSRNAVRFTNAIRCLPVSAGGKLDPSKRKDLELLAACAGKHLYPDIERGAYKLIVPMGSFACRAVFGEAFDLELKHGIPQETEMGVIFPMYHPALGIYEPKKMLMIRTDWMRLRQLLKGTLEIPEDPYPEPDYREVTDADEVALLDPTRPLAGDTESQRGGKPYCLTYSQSPGTGRLIRATNLPVLAAFAKRIATWQAPILFHNWFYDWVVVEEMGLRFPHHRIVDTMAEVYRLGNLPQGLKALAFRELGMVMQDFEDLVIPFSREQVLSYYRKAQIPDWPAPDEELVIDDKTGLWKVYKPQRMSTKLKRFFTDYSKAPDTKDVFLTWDNWEQHQSMIEEQVGPYPGMCISHVPFDLTLHYACRDADALVRFYPLLKHMQSRVRKVTQDKWRE